MKLNKGQAQYHLGVESVLFSNLIVAGSTGPNSNYGDMFGMVEIPAANMRLRYTEGSDIFNPQEGTPQYWAYDEGIYMVWPVPMMDFEVKLLVRPRNGLLAKFLDQILPYWLPRFCEGMKEI